LARVSAIQPESKIEIFTGFKGLKTAYAKEFNQSKDQTLYVLGVTSKSRYSKDLWSFFVNTQKPKRERMGYHVKKILDEDTRGDLAAHEAGAQIRYLPLSSLVSINVIGNLSTMGIFTEEPIILSIESEAVAKTFIEQFELLWRTARP